MFQTITPPEPTVPEYFGAKVLSVGDNLHPVLRKAYYECLRDGHRVERIRAGIAALCVYEGMWTHIGFPPAETRFKGAIVELDRELPDDVMALEAQVGGSRWACVAKIVGIS